MTAPVPFTGTCRQCGKPFTGRRAGKLYCTTKCKSAWNHARDAVTVKDDAARTAFERLVAIAPDDVLDAFAAHVALTVRARRGDAR
ncbi:hypothetical protein [Promicromonospora sp. NPDC023805]|uniref:hypothetical protein n=1 Tax=Promicromonospora sp. NPDC023805 TaxID=3154696 RepID=UPI0033DE76ED